MTRTVLKAKSSYSNEDVAQVWASIADYVPQDEAERAIELAADEVRKVVGGQRDEVVYGWSGGKDSLALQVVMEAAGIRRSVLGTIPYLEWRSYLAWVEEHQPDGLVHLGNTDLSPAWLAQPKNHQYLFPATSKLGYFWTNAGTRWAQKRYQQQHEPPFQIYGRRWADGNQIGPDGFSFNKASGVRSYSPLRSWSHELTLAVIHYSKLTLPPLYYQPYGWTAGTGTWSGRRIGDHDTSWSATWAIEPDRVREAAYAGVPGAADWMERNGHGD